MQREDILTKLRPIIMMELSYDPSKEEETPVMSKTFAEMGLDSIDMADMCTTIEKEFDITIEISETGLDSESTVGDAIDYILKKLHEK